MRSIAIDGPSGSGKSTVAGLLADRLQMLHLDTGAMYRTLAYLAKEEGIEASDASALTELARSLPFSIEGQELFLDGQPLPARIREQEYAKAASVVSAHEGVRLAMQSKQRELAARHPLIMDGRDIGTCVIPDTPYKFYLDAQVEERARRRYEQGDRDRFSYEEVLRALKERDEKDMNRAVAPLKVAEGAIVIDSTKLTIEETVEQMISLMEKFE